MRIPSAGAASLFSLALASLALFALTLPVSPAPAHVQLLPPHGQDPCQDRLPLAPHGERHTQSFRRDVAPVDGGVGLAD